MKVELLRRMPTFICHRNSILVEYFTCNENVEGSIPSDGSNFYYALVVLMISISGFHPVGLGLNPGRRTKFLYGVDAKWKANALSMRCLDKRLRVQVPSTSPFLYVLSDGC